MRVIKEVAIALFVVLLFTVIPEFVRLGFGIEIKSTSAIGHIVWNAVFGICNYWMYNYLFHKVFGSNSSYPDRGPPETDRLMERAMMRRETPDWQREGF